LSLLSWWLHTPALLVGVTTPEKFYFDEAHYVPAARAMLEPVLPSLLLNPMHPPQAKELMAESIRVFGDVPLGWRYPSVLFGSLAIVAMYLCGFVQSRIAMPDISALAFGLSSRDPPDAKLAVYRLCAAAQQRPALAVIGFRRNRLCRFCSAAFVGTSMETFNRRMIFQTWI
jgi:hypothetical protein